MDGRQLQNLSKYVLQGNKGSQKIRETFLRNPIVQPSGRMSSRRVNQILKMPCKEDV